MNYVLTVAVHTVIISLFFYISQFITLNKKKSKVIRKTDSRLGYFISNGHSRQIRETRRLLVRICRGESHFSQKWPLANVGESGEYSVSSLANVGESGEYSVNGLANVGESGESSANCLANVGESGESRKYMSTR